MYSISRMMPRYQQLKDKRTALMAKLRAMVTP
jgi:hypothetical protein